MFLTTARLLFAAACLGSATPARTSGVFTPVLAPLVEDHVLSGAVMLVADRERILHLEAVGFSELAARHPLRTDSLFWIASMTKPLTAAALMMLVDEGRVNVDAPASTYLPQFARVQLRQADGSLRAPARPILVRHLLSHTSGIRYVDTQVATPLDSIPLEHSLTLDLIDPLATEPGESYFYTNTGIDAAALIVERISGRPFEAFLQERLLTPLGMRDTTFFPTSAQLARVPRTYRIDPAKKTLEETRIEHLTYPLDGPGRHASPSGGLFSTARDMSRFCQMLLNGGVFEGKRLLSANAVRAMTTKQTGAEIDARYGFGLSASPDGSEFGHGGAHNTFMTVDRGEIRIFLIHHAGDFRHDAKPGKQFEAEVRRLYPRANDAPATPIEGSARQGETTSVSSVEK